MTLKEAEKEIEIALQCYVDDCISENKKEIKNLELAWRILLLNIKEKK
jgi:predicted RNase H-like HicB family nuclease